MIRKNAVPGLGKSETVPAHNARFFRFVPGNQEKEKKWTVVLLYPKYMMKVYEAAEITVWVRAHIIREAIQKAQFEATNSQLLPIQESTDFSPIFVCEGHVENLLTKE